jgi:hypothetical protein
VAAVWFVARPFLGRGGEETTTEPAPERLALEEERDRALAALKELEFDHRTGAIDDVDYRAMVGPLRRAAADALRALDAQSPKEPARPRREPVAEEPEPEEPRELETVEHAKEPED